MNESTPGQPRCAARIFLPHSAPVQPGWHRCELEGGHELYEEEHHAEPLCGTEVMPFAEGLHSWIRWKGWTTKYEISVFDHCEAPRNDPGDLDNDHCWLYDQHPGRCAWALADA
ncbi:hypothetical protein [Streptomyces sp. NBC_01244]|uniref:hypothetical protein n=1 Tax=Streptomyces sp. NBC_01244 TaxID=2903797 RepID=UPI002E14C51D|nr:hypothetical protein OG247_44445 [Streptomyces sp. NBC_01244]